MLNPDVPFEMAYKSLYEPNYEDYLLFEEIMWEDIVLEQLGLLSIGLWVVFVVELFSGYIFTFIEMCQLFVIILEIEN